MTARDDALAALERARTAYEGIYDDFEVAIRLARRSGCSWAEIAVATGTDSRQTAHRRWRHLDVAASPVEDDEALFNGVGEA